jgi:hypothetical protein
VTEHCGRARRQSHWEADLASAVRAFWAFDAIVATRPAELAPAGAVGRREQQKAAVAGRRELPGHTRGLGILGGSGQDRQQRGDRLPCRGGCASQHRFQVPLGGDLVQQDAVECRRQHGGRRGIGQADQDLGFGTITAVDDGQYAVGVRCVLRYERQVGLLGGGHRTPRGRSRTRRYDQIPSRGTIDNARVTVRPAISNGRPRSTRPVLRQRWERIRGRYAHTFHSSANDCHGCRPES